MSTQTAAVSASGPAAAGRQGSTPALTKVNGTILAAAVAVLVAQLANALPGALNGTFQQYFGTVGSQLTWITAGFMIPVVVFELTFGMLGDRFGHRRLTILGAVTVAIGSLVCALAPSVQVMWIGSAINGLGAGAMYPASLALIAAVTVTPQQRARAIAVWAGCLSAGGIVAPLLGGGFASAGAWQWSYGVVVVLCLLTAVVCLVWSAESTSQSGRRMDLWGQITFALGLILVLFGLVQGPESGWGVPSVVYSLIAGVVLLALFVVIETRVEHPLLKLSLFKNVNYSITSIIAVVGMFAFLGICFSFSMWLGPVQHQDPINIGLLFLLLQGPAFVLIPLISWLMTRVPDRIVLTTGLTLLAAAGLLGATTLDVTDRGMGQFLLPALLAGLGFAFTLSPMTALAINTVPRELAGMASATTNLLRDLGFALGPVLVGAVALSGAARQLGASLATSTLPPDQLGPAQGIFEAGGPFALNSIPPQAPGGAAGELALQSLGTGFGQAFLMCAIAAGLSALLVLVGLRTAPEPAPEPELLADPLPGAVTAHPGPQTNLHADDAAGRPDVDEAPEPAGAPGR
jgi:EmrB/QacA subfamily drug resistance transporter